MLLTGGKGQTNHSRCAPFSIVLPYQLPPSFASYNSRSAEVSLNYSFIFILFVTEGYVHECNLVTYPPCF